MKRDVRLEFFYPQSPDVVWNAIADSEALGKWLMPNDFQARVGHGFQFRMPPKPGFDGIIRCEVTVVEPPHRLAYTWSGGWGSASTLVTWVLEPVQGGTRLVLTHSGFVGIGGFILSQMMRAGWKKKLTTVVADMVAAAGSSKPVAAAP